MKASSWLSSLLGVLVLAGGVFAQTNLNWRGMGDTAQIVGWKGTALKFTKAFNLTNGENKLLAFIFDDTLNHGRVNDSCVAEIGYELGAPMNTLAGKLCTLWTNKIPLDTCNSRTANKRYNPDTTVAASQWTISGDLPVRTFGMIDTTLGNYETDSTSVYASSGMWIGFSPYWSPFIRFYLQGITGNQATAYIKARIVFEQRNYVKVGQ
jgi:hypothetical protein